VHKHSRIHTRAEFKRLCPGCELVTESAPGGWRASATGNGQLLAMASGYTSEAEAINALVTMLSISIRGIKKGKSETLKNRSDPASQKSL
jgi:uncharacterized protein YegP (UPF0339 family)